MAAVTTLLATQALAKHFGGLAAVRDVSLEVAPGEIRAIIGPNGAGKTTLVGMICGRHMPTAGRIFYRGRDITRLPPWERLRLGIAYTFQVTSIYRGLSCYENVALPAQRVTVMDAGAVLAEGTPAEIERHPDVQRAYLGR